MDKRNISKIDLCKKNNQNFTTLFLFAIQTSWILRNYHENAPKIALTMENIALIVNFLQWWVAIYC